MQEKTNGPLVAQFALVLLLAVDADDVQVERGLGGVLAGAARVLAEELGLGRVTRDVVLLLLARDERLAAVRERALVGLDLPMLARPTRRTRHHLHLLLARKLLNSIGASHDDDCESESESERERNDTTPWSE